MAAGPWCGAGRKLGWVPTPAQMHWRGNPTKLAVDKSTVPIGMNNATPLGHCHFPPDPPPRSAFPQHEKPIFGVLLLWKGERGWGGGVWL